MEHVSYTVREVKTRAYKNYVSGYFLYECELIRVNFHGIVCLEVAAHLLTFVIIKCI